MSARDPGGQRRPDRGHVSGAATTRRAVLAGGGAVALGGVAGLAGCLGGGGGRATPTTGSVVKLPPPVAGDPDADVTVAAYEDFSCPHCATYHLEVLPAFERAFIEPGTVRYEHHDFPIPVDDWSWPVASAARAVQDGRGDAAFFAYATRLFEHQGRYSLDRLADLAGAVDADGDQVRRAAAEGTYRPVVAADREAGAERGVGGTPTVFVNDESLVGPTFGELRDAVEAAR